MTDVYKAIQEFNQMRDTGETIDYSFGKETSIGLENGEKVRYSSFGEAMEGIGMTVMGIAGGAGSATLGLPTDIAGLFVGIKDAVSAEEGKRIDAFVNGFTEFSKANLGSEYYRGVFDNFVDSFDVDPKLKEDAKSGFGAGEFGGVGGAVTAGAKVGKKTVKKGLEKIGQKAQQELDLDTGGATLSINAVGEVDKLIKQGLAKLKKPTNQEDGIIAFHGSGVDFDEFKLSKIGTGEGNQAFGYGLYFSDSEDIAKFYKNQILKTQNVEFKGKPIKFMSDKQDISDKDAVLSKIRDRIIGGKFNTKEAIDNVKNEYEQTIENSFDLTNDLKSIDKINYERLKSSLDFINTLDVKNFDYQPGKLYKVKLQTTIQDLLDYDLPLKDQPDNIKKAIKKLNLDFVKENSTGEDIYDLIAVKKFSLGDNKLDREMLKFDDKRVSELLNSVGIKGLKFKSGQLSGIEDSKDTNFVIFDDKIINILAKYGIVGPVAVSSLDLSKQGGADES
tara:strand:+ start:3877 stop:5385 length:1509 start_codon:yes stop_codon:yes gene_type:complete